MPAKRKTTNASNAVDTVKTDSIKNEDMPNVKAEDVKKETAPKRKKPAAKRPAAPVEPEQTVQETAPIVTEIRVVPKRKILFVASESTPFIATGGLAEVIGSLSKALAQNSDYDVRVVIPLYSDIPWDYRNKFKYLGNIFVPLAWRNQYCGIFSYEMNGVTFYFLDNGVLRLL